MPNAISNAISNAIPSLRHRALRASLVSTIVLAVATLPSGAAAQQQSITTPKQQFGHNIGDDYWLANYDQFSQYWHKLASESDRMKLVDIGQTAEGRPELMAIISSAENMKHLDRYKEISQRLAHAEGLTDEQARALAKEGKAVVWIDGGLHASEVLGAHQLMETVYQLLSRNDEETTRILNDCIILAVQVNPDGMQLVSNWYMKDADTLKRNMDVPRLWQKYVGHDNNRDFYMSNQAESKNINHVLFWDWFPQIVYNHHQTGPAGAVMFSPPFRDPFNYNFDPMIVTELDLIGAAMHDRFNREHKPGVVTRSAASYSTWWNGGLRTVPYFHNMIGLLTEAIGNPTPEKIPFVPSMQLPRGDVPYPIAPQVWHFRQSIDYSVTANYAVLDLASRQKDEFLYDIYGMGRNSIEKGSHDSWTISGDRIAAVDSAVAANRPTSRGASSASAGVAPRAGSGVDDKYFPSILHDPAKRDPRGYVITADQPDFLTATKFVNTLRHVGITVQRATAPFSVGGKQYPAGSFVVKTAQAFRPYVLDMFEPQDYPNDFAYPGGPPTRPYDNTGYTLAYQMGVQFDRVLNGFDGPFEVVNGLAKPPVGTISNASGAAGFLFSHAENDAFIVVNRLLKNRAAVYWLRSPTVANGRTYPAGTFYVAAGSGSMPIVQKAAQELGVSFYGTNVRPGVGATKLQPRRLALWDTYGGSMPSGQIRWLLEQFEFPYTLVYPQDIDAGTLAKNFDAVILPSGAILGEGASERGYTAARERDIPAQYQHMTGRLTEQKSVPAIRQFLETGGTVLTIGSSTRLGSMLGLPVANALVERSPTGAERPLPADKFYVPGAILNVAVDDNRAVAAGAPPRLDVFYDNSPVFRLEPDAALKGVHPVAWFDSAHPLRSGWAWGQNYLEGSVAIAEAKVGKGELYLFGPEITFRAQPHGTFRFLFNGIYAGTEK
ncbi:MAG: M14 family metallopeptidase [Gemmatimonadaceae bacterium]